MKYYTQKKNKNIKYNVHAVGHNKLNVPKFMCCDCVDWTVTD